MMRRLDDDDDDDEVDRVDDDEANELTKSADALRQLIQTP
jgi:hypothetical protein